MSGFINAIPVQHLSIQLLNLDVVARSGLDCENLVDAVHRIVDDHNRKPTSMKGGGSGYEKHETDSSTINLISGYELVIYWHRKTITTAIARQIAKHTETEEKITTTNHFLLFFISENPRRVFALSSNQAWSVVRPYADHSFSVNVAKKVANPRKIIQVVRQCLFGPMTREDLLCPAAHELYKTSNLYYFIENFKCDLKEDSVLFRMIKVIIQESKKKKKKTKDEDEEETVERVWINVTKNGLLRIGRRLPIDSFPRILDQLAQYVHEDRQQLNQNSHAEIPDDPLFEFLHFLQLASKSNKELDDEFMKKMLSEWEETGEPLAVVRHKYLQDFLLSTSFEIKIDRFSHYEHLGSKPPKMKELIEKIMRIIILKRGVENLHIFKTAMREGKLGRGDPNSNELAYSQSRINGIESDTDMQEDELGSTDSDSNELTDSQSSMDGVESDKEMQEDQLGSTDSHSNELTDSQSSMDGVESDTEMQENELGSPDANLNKQAYSQSLINRVESETKMQEDELGFADPDSNKLAELQSLINGIESETEMQANELGSTDPNSNEAAESQSFLDFVETEIRKGEFTDQNLNELAESKSLIDCVKAAMRKGELRFRDQNSNERAESLVDCVKTAMREGKLRYKDPYSNETGEPLSLMDCVEGEMRFAEENYFKIKMAWYILAADHLALLCEDFKNMVKKHLIKEGDVAQLPLRWAGNEGNESEDLYCQSYLKDLPEDLRDSPEDLPENLPSYLVFDQIYPDGNKIEPCDILKNTKHNVYLYHVKEKFGQCTRDACSQILNAAAMFQGALSLKSRSSDYLEQLWEKATQGPASSKELWKNDVKRQAERIGKDKFLDMFRDDRKLVFVYAYLPSRKRSFHNLLKTIDEPFEQGIMDKLRECGYVDSYKRVTGKFYLIANKDDFKLPGINNKAKCRRIYDQLAAGKFLKSTIAKLELVRLAQNLRELNFEFKICEIARKGGETEEAGKAKTKNAGKAKTKKVNS